jgi:hypothetical protein
MSAINSPETRLTAARMLKAAPFFLPIFGFPLLFVFAGPLERAIGYSGLVVVVVVVCFGGSVLVGIGRRRHSLSHGETYVLALGVPVAVLVLVLLSVWLMG